MTNCPLHPKHPESVCWGCDNFCPAHDMRCSKDRTQHPAEGYGENWDLTEPTYRRTEEPGAIFDKKR